MERWDKLAQIEAERKQQTDYAVQNSLDARRYRKLKAYRDECRDSEWAGLWQSINLDSTVDALPEVTK